MSLAITSLSQIAIMIFIILVGFICYITKLIDTDTNKKLSDLLLMVVNPFVIFVSYQRKFDSNLLSGLLISLTLAIITHLFSILFTGVALRKKNHEADIAIERFGAIYSNCGFIGIPLVNGMFGSEGVFYMAAYMTIFNLVVWTHGFVTISGHSDKKTIMKAILSPSVIATVSGFVLFVCKIMLPHVLVQAITYIGDMNTPLAMLVAGVTIAQTEIGKVLKKVRIYYIAFLKLLIIPIVMLLIFNMFHLPKLVLLTSVLAAACPTAASINLFALRYDKNYLYASEIFAVTTIFSVFTIPMVMIIANFFV